MKVVAIEIAEVVERDIAKFLEENEKAGAMRFTRFVDLGGKQIELSLYPPQQGASVWCTIGIKSVFRTDQGECIAWEDCLIVGQLLGERLVLNEFISYLSLAARSARCADFHFAYREIDLVVDHDKRLGWNPVIAAHLLNANTALVHERSRLQQ